MKNITYYFAQTSNELEHIFKSDDTTCVVPLNLEILLYCINKKINYLKLDKIIKNSFHSKTLIFSNKIEKKIRYGTINYNSIRSELKSIIRFKFYSIAFLTEILKFVGKNKIVLSGWSGINFKKYNSNIKFYLSELISDIAPNANLVIEEKILQNASVNNNIYEYFADNINLKKNNKIIYLNNTAYNFWRIIREAQKGKYKIIFPIFKKVNFFKMFVYYFLNVQPVFFKKKISKNKSNFIFIPKINVSYKNINLNKIINKTISENLYYLNDLLKKANCLKIFLNKTEISLVVLNIIRGLDGCVAEILKKTAVPTVNVSHGTVSEYFNKVDKIYKSNIAEAVFGGDCKFTTIATKISLLAHKKFKIKSKAINGNIIFSGIASQSKIRKNILCAVTLKDFENFQLHGVETYYEFVKNLYLFNYMVEKNGLKFIINLHPTQIKCKDLLKKIFPKLKFTTSKIEKALKKSFVTISFSSSVIEDSISSNIPVILYDPYKRYKHCKSETRSNKISDGIYYINKEKKLYDCIKFIKNNCDKINIKKINFNNDYNFNIRNNLFSLIK